MSAEAALWSCQGDVSEACKLHALEEENRRLKRLVADLSLDNQMLKGLNPTNSEARGSLPRRGLSPGGVFGERESGLPRGGPAPLDLSL